MPLATLSIDIVANLARLEGEMRRAAGTVESAAARMSKAFGGVGTVFAGSVLASAATEAIKGLLRLFPDLVNGAAHFQDLEEKTGASAAALASFTTAGDVAGVSADQLAGFMVKLTAGLAKTSEESKGVGPAIKALGIDLESFRELAPEKQFELIAQRLNTFKDGAGKTAIAVALLGKSGADALPFFKELAQSGLTQNRLTAEQIRLADDYVDAQARVTSELKQAAQIAALQVLPAFTALTAELTKAAREALGLDDAADKLAGNNAIREFAEGGAEALTVLADAAVFASRAVQLVVAGVRTAEANRNVAQVFFSGPDAALEFLQKGSGTLKAALDAREKAVAESDKRVKALLGGDDFAITKALKGRFATTKLAESAGINDIGKLFGGGTDQRPALKFTVPEASGAAKANTEASGAAKANTEAAQVRKALLDQALKNLESAFQNESDAIQFHQRFLEAQYNNGLVSVQGYYAAKGDIENRALDATISRLEKERAALQGSLNDPAFTDASKRIEVATKLEEIEAKAGRARQQRRDQEALNSLAQARDEQQRLDRAREFQAQLLELQGQPGAAANLRADAAIDNAKRSAAGTGITPQQLQEFEAATRASQRFGEAQREVQRITEQASIAEQRFLIQAEASGASRIEVEQGLRAIRTESLGQLSEQLAKLEALAAAAGPDSPAVQFARQLRLEFERLNATVDPTILRMREVGDEVADALGRAAGAITLNFRNAKSAVQSLGDSITRILSRELIEQPLTDFFRKSIRGITEGGQGGGLGDVLKGAFGFGGVGGGGDLGAPFNPKAAPINVGAFGFGFGARGGALGTPFNPNATPVNASGFSLAGAFGVPEVELSLTRLSGALDAATPGFDGFTSNLLKAGDGLGGLPGFIQSLFGGAGGAGGAGLSGIFASALSLFGFADGGWTGPGPRNKPAGIVHADEVVWSQDDVRRAGGVQVVDGMRRGLRGYADGGVVVMPFRGAPAPAQASAPGRRGGTRGGDVFNIQVSVPAGMDSRTEEQLMAKLGRAVQNAGQRRTNPAH